LVFDYVSHSLDRLLKGGKNIPEDRAVKIVRDICLGVKYLHTQKVVHRDLKVSNIYINGDTSVIGEFGLACKLEYLG
jgi:serine/threonine protein kinase